MKNNKFFTLLRHISREELVAFDKYIKRLHSGELVTLSVFEYIKKVFPDLDNPSKLEMANAYQKIFKQPLEAHDSNRTKMLNALSDLHLWLKEFLLLEKTKDDSFESRAFWVTILNERKIITEASRQAIRLHDTMNLTPKRTISDYLKAMATNYFFYYHLLQDKQKPNLEALHLCGAELDQFYAIIRLKLACEMAIRKNTMSLDFNQEMLPVVMKISGANERSPNPLLQLYLSVYDLINNHQGHRYAEIENLMVDHIKKVHPEEIQTILSYLQHYASERIRQGDETYWSIIHRLDKFSVSHGILAANQQVSATQFNNIINVACKVKDLDWATFFIQSHQQFLEETVRKDNILLAEAMILFEKGLYQQTLQVLRGVDFTDLHHAIRSKAFMLRSYYELADPKVDIVEFCITFEVFLKRQKKSEWKAVKATLSFIRVVKMLARGKAAKANILQEIESTDLMYFKPWLLEKAADYMGGWR